jgi:hypothetical protein
LLSNMPFSTNFRGVQRSPIALALPEGFSR